MKNSKSWLVGLVMALVMMGGVGKAEALQIEVGTVQIVYDYLGPSTSTYAITVSSSASKGFDFTLGYYLGDNLLSSPGFAPAGSGVDITGTDFNILPVLSSFIGTFEIGTFDDYMPNSYYADSTAITWDFATGADYATLFVNTRETQTAVPEPGTIALLGGGLAGLVFWRRRSNV